MNNFKLFAGRVHGILLPPLFAWLICSLALGSGSLPQAYAQEVPAAKQQSPLTDAQVRDKYQNCPGGWYSGPRPGKTRFARDPWLWVVSPEFAQRFCMPPEFVSADLKGSEAVAFRLLRKTDEENCGFGGNPDACGGEVVLRFDVYIKSDVKLPKIAEGRYFQRSLLPSSKLISRTEREWNFLGEQHKNKPESALQLQFEPQQVALHGVKDGRIAWPIVSLSQQTHFGGVFEGIDYYALEGSTGFFENPGIKQNNVKRFFINFKRLDRDKFKPLTGQSLSEMAYTIELPEVFTNQVSEMDQSRGHNVRALLNDAFNKPKVVAKPGTTIPAN